LDGEEGGTMKAECEFYVAYNPESLLRDEAHQRAEAKKAENLLFFPYL